MSAPVDTLIDGNWIKPEPTGAPRFVYPFRLNGDRVSAYFQQDYLQQASTSTAPLPFVPSVLSIPHDTLRDFYLIVETPPVFGLANLLGFTRTYSRIPSTQISYSSQAITKPAPSTFGSLQGFYADNAGNSSGLQDYLYSSYYFLANKVYGPRQASTSVNSGSDTRVTCTAHGIVAGDSLVASKISGVGIQQYIFLTTQFTVIDANTIDLLGINLTNTIVFLAKYYRAFTPGVDRVGTKLSQAFYLPGVTTGITTPADIPIPDPLLNDLALIDSLLAHPTGYQTYDSTALAQWMASPIYTQTAIQINMGDL